MTDADVDGAHIRLAVDDLLLSRNAETDRDGHLFLASLLYRMSRRRQGRICRDDAHKDELLATVLPER